MGLIEDEFSAVTPEYVVQFNSTTWGWIHILIGLVVIAAGFGIFSGNVLARTVGVFAALGSMISVFAWLPWHPVWGIALIAMNIAIVWALTVHGRVLADH